MYKDVVIAGFGGQGVIFAGKLLSYAGLKEGKEVIFYPSYGAEMRGGTANCTVIISDSMIPSPIISHPSSAIVMSYPAFDKFLPRIKRGGQVVINASLIKEKVERDDLCVMEVPTNKIAKKLGSSKVANMVALGAWARLSGVVGLKTLVSSLKEVLSPDKSDLLEINESALEEGWRFVSGFD